MLLNIISQKNCGKGLSSYFFSGSIRNFRAYESSLLPTSASVHFRKKSPIEFCRSLSTKNPVMKKKSPSLIYDEDLHNIAKSAVLRKKVGIRDVTEQELNSKEYVIDDEKIEEILRRYLPKDKVDEALVEHRKFREDFKKGDISKEQVKSDYLKEKKKMKLTEKKYKKSKAHERIISRNEDQRTDADEDLPQDSEDRKMQDFSEKSSDEVDDLGFLLAEGPPSQNYKDTTKELLYKGEKMNFQNVSNGSEELKGMHNLLEKAIEKRRKAKANSNSKTKSIKLNSKEPNDFSKDYVPFDPVVNPSGFTLSEGLAEARILLKLEKFREAENLYKSLTIEFTQPGIMMEYARNILAKKKDLYSACKAAIFSYKIDNSDEDVNSFLADSLLAYSDSVSRPKPYLIMAQQHADRITEKSGKDPKIVHIRAKILMRLGKYKKANEIFKIIHSLLDHYKVPKIDRIPYEIDYAKTLVALENFNKALEILENCYNISPDNLEVLGLIVQLNSEFRKNFTQALLYLQRAIKLDPSNPKYYYNLGEICSNPENPKMDLETARKAYEKTLFLNKDPELFFKIGYICMQMREKESAIEYFIRAEKYDPDHRTRLISLAFIGEVHAFDSDPESLESAIQYYQMAIDGGLVDNTVKLNMVKCLLRKGSYERSRDISLEILLEDPHNTEVLNILADISLLLGKNFEALRYLEKALSIEPNNTVSLFMRGKIYFANQETTKCQISLKKSLELEEKALKKLTNDGIVKVQEIPFAFEAYYMLGQTYLAEEKFQEAYDSFNMCLDVEPNNLLVNLHLGEISENLNKHDLAIHYFRKSVFLDPHSVRAQFHLANSLLKEMRYDLSICQFESLLELLKQKNEDELETEGILLKELYYKIYISLSMAYKKESLVDIRNSADLMKKSNMYRKLAELVEKEEIQI